MKTSCIKWLIISNNASCCCCCRGGRTACFNLEHATSLNVEKWTHQKIEDKHFRKGPFSCAARDGDCGCTCFYDLYCPSTLFVVEDDSVDPPGSTAISAQFQNSSPNFSLLQQLFSSSVRVSLDYWIKCSAKRCGTPKLNPPTKKKKLNVNPPLLNWPPEIPPLRHGAEWGAMADSLNPQSLWE